MKVAPGLPAAVASALKRLRAIEAQPPPYGDALTVVAYALSSAASARFFDSGWPEMAAASIAGLAVGLLAVAMARSANTSRVYELTAAFMAALIAHLARHLGLENSVQVTLLAGVIVLVPGLTLTVAMAEIATHNLVAGSVRAMAAAGTLLQILVGTAGMLAANATVSPKREL